MSARPHHPGDTVTTGWACGAFRPASEWWMKPYRCSEPHDHPGDHRAVVDGEVLAQWPRPVPSTPEETPR